MFLSYIDILQNPMRFLVVDESDVQEFKPKVLCSNISSDVNGFFYNFAVNENIWH